MKTKLKNVLLVTACAAPLLTFAASAQKLARVEDFLDADGDLLILADPSYLKKQLVRDLDLTGKAIKKETDGESRVLTMSIFNTVRQSAQALGLGRLGCYGLSVKALAGEGAPAKYVEKSRVLIGAADKPDFIGALSGGRLEAAELATAPEGCEAAFHADLDAVKLYGALRRVGSFAVMAREVCEPWLKENVGCSAEELLAGVKGRFSVYVGDGWVKVSVPDPQGKLFSAIMRLGDDWELTGYGMNSGPVYLLAGRDGRLEVLLADAPEECGKMAEWPFAAEALASGLVLEDCGLFCVLTGGLYGMGMTGFASSAVYDDRIDNVSGSDRLPFSLMLCGGDIIDRLMTAIILLSDEADDDVEVLPAEEEDE